MTESDMKNVKTICDSIVDHGNYGSAYANLSNSDFENKAEVMREFDRLLILVAMDEAGWEQTNDGKWQQKQN